MYDFNYAEDVATGRRERDGHDYLYLPNELHFAASGPPMARNGWAVYPQDRDERRRPARIDGTPILWSKYHDVAPTPEEIHRWSIYAATANTAIILGPPSGNVICLDCDILDEALSFAVREVAVTTLGESPFRRVGTHPKVALFYRMPADELPRYQKYVFTQSDGVSASEDMIEILARGRSITAEGLHHKTGSYFTWLDANPISSRPERAPLITTEQLKTFFAEVERLRPFVRREREFDASVDLETIAVGDKKVELPRTPKATYDPATGKIVSGRPTWLFELVKDAVVCNAALAARDDPELIEAIVAKAARGLDLTGSKWAGVGALREDVRKQLRARVQAMRDGKLRPRQIATWTSDNDVDDDTLSLFSTKTALQNIEIIAPPDPVRAAQRKLTKDRSAARASVQQQLDDAIDGWIADVVDGNGSVRVINAPTGSGKTTRTVQRIPAHPRLLDVIRAITGEEGEHERRGPIVILLPSHNNIDEIMRFAILTHLDADASDDQLVVGAVEAGWNETEARAEVGKIRRFAVGRQMSVMRLDGKARGGCYKSDLIAKLSKVGASSSMLCRSTVRVDGHSSVDFTGLRINKLLPTGVIGLTGAKLIEGSGENALVYGINIDKRSGNVEIISMPEGASGAATLTWSAPINEERFCDQYDICPVIAQRRALANADIVFMPRAYLTLPVPPELKRVAGVVADERIFSDIIGSGDLPFRLLAGGRAAPALTQKERDAGVEEMHLLVDRQAGAHIVMHALRDGLDPAEVLYAHRDQISARTIKLGGDYVKAGKRVAGTAFTRGHSIDPSQPLDQLTRAIDELVAQPTGEKLREEYGLWRTLDARLEKRAGAEPDRPKSRKDPLLQYKRDEAGNESVRISYAADINWPHAPWLLLDASADETILESIFPDREIVTTDVSADVNMRAVVSVDFEWPKKLILPNEDCSPAQRLEAAQILANARNYISMICGLHANGQVLVGTTLMYRKAIETGWTPPENADFVHFGATSGLDFARNHAAAIGIGRSEKPQNVIDGEVGALVRNDEQPEEPIDKFGLFGYDPFGEKLPPPPLVHRPLRLRDGADATYLVRQPSGPKASALVRQYREEEIRQFIGRLRALQRELTTTVYLVTKAVPEDLIVDRIVPLTEMKTLARNWEAVRRAKGAIEPRLLSKVAPDIGNEIDFRKWMRRLPKAVLARYHRVTAAGTEYLIPGYVEDPASHLHAFGTLRPADHVEIVERCGCTLLPAAARPMDKIEAHLAEHAEERAKYVAEFMASQWAHIKDKRIDIAASNGTYLAPGIPDEIAHIAKTVDVWMAYSTMMDPWIRGDADDLDQAHPNEVVPEAANDDRPVDPLVAAIRQAFGMGAA